MTQQTVELVRDPTADGEEILIAVGSSDDSDENASSKEVDAEFEDGMLKIKLPEDKRRLTMQCVVNGSWDVGDDLGW